MSDLLSKFKKVTNKLNLNATHSLIDEYKIDVENLEVVSDFDIFLNKEEKNIITEKLLEAHILAKTNVECGNITGRGFATNVCDNELNWTVGTNFNNTRNDISSICGERTAILGAYNKALLNHVGNPNEFDFKIKYMCMATHVSLNEIQKTVAPCEDCLSWLNTNRYFDNNAIIFSFERDENRVLKICAVKLLKLLPYKNIVTSTKNISGKRFELSQRAAELLLDNKKQISIMDLISVSEKTYKKYNFSKISNQNVVCSILSNNEIISSYKIDWTRRWNLEPLEFCAGKAIEKFGIDTKIQAICYFGDEFANNNYKLKDGVISIKSLGRIRQKYANSDTLLILNLKDGIFVLTMGEYLPEKFEQGYIIK